MMTDTSAPMGDGVGKLAGRQASKEIKEPGLVSNRDRALFVDTNVTRLRYQPQHVRKPEWRSVGHARRGFPPVQPRPRKFDVGVRGTATTPSESGARLVR